MKPNDVSDRAWWFACNEIERAEPYRQHLTGEVYMTSEEVLPMLRVALARAFDAATVDLRDVYEIAPYPMTIPERATLDAYTPGESK